MEGMDQSHMWRVLEETSFQHIADFVDTKLNSEMVVKSMHYHIVGVAGRVMIDGDDAFKMFYLNGARGILQGEPFPFVHVILNHVAFDAQDPAADLIVRVPPRRKQSVLINFIRAHPDLELTDSSALCVVCDTRLGFTEFDSVRKLEKHVSGKKHRRNANLNQNSAITVVVKSFLRANTSRDNYRNAYRTHLTKQQLHQLFTESDPEHPMTYSTFCKITNTLRLKRPTQVFCACPLCFGLDERVTVEQMERHVALKEARLETFKAEIEDPSIIVVTADYASNIAQYAPIVSIEQVRSTQTWVLLSFVLHLPNGEFIYYDFVTESCSKDSALSCSTLHQFYRKIQGLISPQTTVSMWSDNGSHFHNNNWVAHCLSLGMKVCFFAPYHGKSQCDRHFGSVARLRKTSTIKTFRDVTRLLGKLTRTQVFRIEHAHVTPFPRIPGIRLYCQFEQTEDAVYGWSMPETMLVRTLVQFIPRALNTFVASDSD